MKSVIPLLSLLLALIILPSAERESRGDKDGGPAVAAVVPAVQGEVQPLINQHLAELQKKALDKLVQGDKVPASFKTPLWLKAAGDPWTALIDAEKQGLGVARTGLDGAAKLPVLLDQLSAMLGKPAGTAQVVARPKLASLGDHAQYIISVLDKARDLRDAALARLTPEQRKVLFARPPKLANTFWVQDDWKERKHERLQGDHAFVTQFAEQVDWPAFLGSVQTLLALCDPVYLAELRTALEAASPINDTVSGVIGPILLKKDSRHGLILFAGKGDNTYDVQTPLAFLADIGGNDRYQGTVAASYDVEHPFAVVADFAGDDIYECERFGLACGRLGAGVLVDLAGKDTYKLERGCGGTGFAGVGILCDVQGDDVYTGSSWTQGAACAGLGLLLDLAGNDRHTSHGYAVGFGGPFGVGAVIDVSGNDSYLCGKHFGSGYNQSDAPNAKPGDPNYQYESFGLGCGAGRRIWPPAKESDPFQLAGGVGLVLDLAGDDRYESSNFSQACGYFFGTGMLLDRQGNDTYIAARYGYAAGAHRGLGLFVDYLGNDVYDSTGPTYNGGCSWDRSVMLFVDAAGDDTYRFNRSGGFGRADHGSWGVFVERGGKDTYLGSGFGMATDASVGVFFDAAGDDDYKGAGPIGDFRPGNGQTRVHPNDAGLFVDRP